MIEKERQKAFNQERRLQARRKAAMQNASAAEIATLLKTAFESVQATLDGQPSDYELWRLPEVKKAIEAVLREFGEDAGATAAARQADIWEAGQDLIDLPIQAGGIAVKGVLPAINKRQLTAMQSFLTGKMKDVGGQALARINGQLGLMMIGGQGLDETIKGIQDAETMARKRSVTIIRTELGRAYATAGHERSMQASRHLPGLQKQWRRSGKIHSRRSHDLADGQVRPVDKPFIMGTGAVIDGQEGNGARLMYPHDPAAPASETVNCGCLSLPFMDSWKAEGLLKDSGKRAFTEEEIALNPAKAEFADMMENGPTIQDVLARK